MEKNCSNLLIFKYALSGAIFSTRIAFASFIGTAIKLFWAISVLAALLIHETRDKDLA
jgi:hypothetical protein